METYYVLSGNAVIGHFDTLRESWTLEEALEMANICTTQSGLETMFYDGIECVHLDLESNTFVLDVNTLRVLNFEPKQTILELCERIRNSCEWDPADTCILCDLAGLNEEWLNATGENFEQVVCSAAEKMGGMVL